MCAQCVLTLLQLFRRPQNWDTRPPDTRAAITPLNLSLDTHARSSRADESHLDEQLFLTDPAAAAGNVADSFLAAEASYSQQFEKQMDEHLTSLKSTLDATLTSLTQPRK